ncbi:MAG: Uma2 family endonuclease [Isosphaeraceae bacterium]|nr:Uma2 family endonuclease [Isosphaeraceae bacterium]
MATGELRTTETIPRVNDPGALAPGAAPASAFHPHRISVDRYHRMIASGCIAENEPIFLWKGQLVEKMTKGHRHSNSSAALVVVLPPLVSVGWHLRPEQSTVLGDDTEPEPDFMIVRGAVRDYQGRIPTARDIALIIEVADSSLAVDSGEVLEKYAQEGIPVYWIVNIPQQRIEMFSHPQGGRYTEHRPYGPGEAIPVVLDGHEVGRIAVSEVLF